MIDASGKSEGQIETKVESFDPDEDGFVFGIGKAQQLHKTINIL
jgi:hypothetical protein